MMIKETLFIPPKKPSYPIFYAESRNCARATNAASIIITRNSFKHVEKYHNEILAYRDDDVPVAIAANKSDLADQRTVTREDGRDLAERLNASFVETSAKTNTNVEKMFEDICRDVIRRRRHTTKKFTFATPSNSECDSDSSSDEDPNCLERCFRSCCCFVGQSKRKT